MNDADYFFDLDSLSDEEFFSAYEPSDADIKYRSVTVGPQIGGEYLSAYHQQTNNYSMPLAGANFKLNTFSKPTPAVSNSNRCPTAPFGISKTNFIINKSDYNTVTRSIAENLKGHENFDFSFVEEHLWRGKYLCSSSCFELEVCLYQENAGFKVAVRKISSDCAMNSTFTNFFNAMKCALSTDLCPAPRKAFVIPTGVSLIKLSDAEFLEGIQPIFRMVEHNNECRVQCAKMLCDVSQKDAHYLELPAFRLPCVKLLESLILDESEDVRQYAVMAVAAFAELPTYKEALMCSAVLPVLFGLIENCAELQQAYETAQVRRTAARVLALLSRTHPYTVRAELQQQACDVTGWLQRVACLQDTRTREYALVAKSFLEEVTIDESLFVSDEDAMLMYIH